jgi:predicted ester cyclase
LAEVIMIRRGRRAFRAFAVIAAVLSCSWIVSAQQQAPTPEQIATKFVEDIWNKGDLAVSGEIMASQVTLHYRGQAIPLTAESGSAIVQTWRAAFPDFHFRIEDMIVQRDKVVLRIPFTGTHRGRFWGLEPTGKRIDVSETLILRLEHGKVAEMWEDYDEYGMRIQLGLIKPPTAP